MQSISKITRERFDALCMSRSPRVKQLAAEVDWYSDESESVLGTILYDFTDDDWNIVVLGRAEDSLFRCIDVECSIVSLDAARLELFRKLVSNSKPGYVFKQFESGRVINDIFLDVVAEGKLNPIYLSLRDYVGHTPAKEIMREIGFAFTDVDGNFNEQFQTTGFNSRLFELYMFAYLCEEKFYLDSSVSYPDYHIRKNGIDLCIECTTCNPSEKFDINWVPEGDEQLRMVIRDYLPIKFGSSLFSKLKKRYWEQQHVAGKPIVIAIHDFHKSNSMTWSCSALGEYLYGYRYGHIFDNRGNLVVLPKRIERHQWLGKEIPSGFFKLDGAENISAVLGSSSATISKFNRMGKLANFGDPNVKMLRIGYAYDHDPHAVTPMRFSIVVEQDLYTETWGQGLMMYHNPTALHSIPPEMFPGIAHSMLSEDNHQVCLMPDFYPYNSTTLVFSPRV